MKNREKLNADYTALKRKVYLKMVLMTALSLAVVVLILALVDNRLANVIVDILQRVFNVSFLDAQTLYLRFIRHNTTAIILVTVGVILIVLVRFLLFQFSKYFNEISRGLDVLVERRDSEIKLSPEMAAMEQKLKTIKQTLEKREIEAKEAEQRKNDVVVYLAHDIKTPLTSVVGYLSLLDERPDMPPEQKEKYVAITLEKACQLEKLVDEFFEITRYNFQMITLAKEKIDLSYMLIQMADEFYPQLATKGQEISLHVPESLAVYGDPEKLARVFNNLLKNAALYSPDHSTIEIRATISNNALVITFQNEGTIPKDQLESIFDKFYRLDSSRSSTSGGAGLGLAIVKEIVLLHGGQIYAGSKEGKTTFLIELPIQPEQS